MEGRRTLIAVVAAAVLALAGCGGEAESQDAEADAPAAGEAVVVRETEFSLDPPEVRLDSAGTYTFRAVNDGSVDHALEIEGNGVEEETETIPAGESAELSVRLEDGTYELYCPVGNHKTQGMAGRVVVGAGGAATTTDGTETDDDRSKSDPGEGYGY